jgi:hypothetical protein
MLIRLKLDAKLVIENAQGSVVVTYDGLRHDRLHFLRHHADIHAVAAVIAEAIVAEAVSEMAEKNDIVLERNIGPPSATTTTATAATAATTTTATAACAHATATATCSHATTAATTAETRAATRGLPVGYSARPNIPKSVAATSSTRRSAGTWPTTRRSLPRAGPTTRRSLARAGPLSRTRSLRTAARPENLFATAAAKIHPVLSAVTTVIVAEPLVHTRVIVSHALAMFGSMLPVIAV